MAILHNEEAIRSKVVGKDDMYDLNGPTSPFFSSQPGDSNISHLMEELTGLICIVGSIEGELRKSGIGSAGFAGWVSSELNVVLEKSDYIRKSITHLFGENSNDENVQVTHQAIEDVSYEVEETKRILRQSTVATIVDSGVYMLDQIRSESSVFSLHLSLQQLKNHLRTLNKKPSVLH